MSMSRPEHLRLADRIAALDWPSIHRSLDEHGYSTLPAVLTPAECGRLIAGYDEPSLYRKRIAMARHSFGIGEYQYFAAPLPEPVQELRTALYPQLAEAANRWLELAGEQPLYPQRLDEYLEQCGALGQTKPTPLILKYEAGGYNCLHQDLYGEAYFPFQVVFVLNRRTVDFTGGELLLVEQRPRAQSRGHVITLEQGEALIFPTRHRPVKGTRGYYRTTLRHGVSTVSSGVRYSLGIIFHDAR